MLLACVPVLAADFVPGQELEIAGKGRAGDDGRWEIPFAPGDGEGPHRLAVALRGYRIVREGILLGEV